MPEAYWYGLDAIPPEGKTPGTLVRARLRNRPVTGVILEVGNPELPYPVKPLDGLVEGASSVPPEWLEMLAWIARYYLAPLPQVFATALSKQAQKLLFEPLKRKPKAPKTRPIPPPPPDFTATPDQQSALTSILAALNPPRRESFLLHGVTGSGKTWVYLHAARATLAQGRQVLVLLPEIALTPQTLERFEAFLGRSAFPFHSGLSVPERRRVWQAIMEGSADLIVGARSSVLLPFTRLGLIVVDEEHDGSYKQTESAPRYHARDVALYRGRQSNCPVILGSATPSLETYYAATTGKLQLLTMAQRATGALPPRLQPVDMRGQLALQGDDPLSEPLREAVLSALAAGEQAILFLNRRGYAPRRICQDCGEAKRCRDCDAALVFHRKGNRLLCHHCGRVEPPKTPCRSCGGETFQDAGLGIEKMEERLRRAFPGVPIERLDRDSAEASGGPNDILDRFRKGEVKILLGTQMVAKGHDFPSVNLVGVLDADAGLGLPDFRAQERAFQLITQVAGRSGRHRSPSPGQTNEDLAGRVILQTFKPGSELLEFARQQDYAGFFATEIERRRELDYPPFKRLLLCEIAGPTLAPLEAAMTAFAAQVRERAAQSDVRVLGPGQAALGRLRGDYRAHLLLKGSHANRLHWTIEGVWESLSPQLQKSLKLRWDMDPVSLL
jgi:primosomal protein N' (replication factor Y)